jgi:hypothetical protein
MNGDITDWLRLGQGQAMTGRDRRRHDVLT